MRALATQAGISQPFLSQLERGASAPSMLTTYRLAQALGVQPGELLPTPGVEAVAVVRADEGRVVPVSDRPDAAVGRVLLLNPDSPLEVIEYVVEPGRHLGDWFSLDGELAVYVVDGELDVEVAGEGTWRLGPRDLLTHAAVLRHRWTLASERAVHLLLVIAHPA